MILYNIATQHKTLDEAWSFWFDLIQSHIPPETGKKRTPMKSRDGNVVGEVINATTVISDPTRCIMRNEIRKLPMRYLIGEMLWYRAAQNTLDGIQNYTPAWDRMSDDGVHVNSNYGWCIHEKFGFDQWNYIKELLKKDPATRQAIVHIKTAEDSLSNPTKDMNCTLTLQFFIRDRALHLTVNMRSNDLWMGFPNDIFQFTAMQIQLAMELGVGIGIYTHNAGSLHLYERDYETALSNLSKMCTSPIDGVSAIERGGTTVNVTTHKGND